MTVPTDSGPKATIEDLRRRLSEAQGRAERAEGALGKVQERFRRILGTVPGYLYSAEMVDGVPRYELVTPGVEQVSGYTAEEHGARAWFWLSTILPDDRPAVERALARLLAGSPATLEYRIVRKDGSIRWVRDSAVAVTGPDGGAVRVDGIVTDVTERKEMEESNRRLQEQLHQAHKMEAIGTLAGGIAHDFNNMLGVIIGYASLLRSQIGEDHPFSQPLDTIERSADRAAGLTRQLLGFARGGKYKAEPVSLNDVVVRVVDLFGSSARPAVAIKTDLAEDLPPTEGDIGQIGQILMNLCLNARDAMPRGGTLRIGTCREELGEAFTETRPWARKGDFVRLSVEDTGTGMTPETMARMFEPFFTTKAPGTGSGMGLAMAYGAMKNHGGFIDVRSEPGRGSEFRLYFPVTWRARRAGREAGEEEVRGGSEDVLVIEADPSFRRLAGDFLSRAGYGVLSARNGEEACALLQEGQCGGTALALLDIDAPGMGAKQTFLTLRGTLPDLRVLVATSQGVEGAVSELLQMGAAGFVEKPYRPEKLLHAVRRTLDS